MNDIITTEIVNSIKDIIEHPDLYQDEMIAAAFESVSEASARLSEAKKLLEGRLIERMQNGKATKMIYTLGENSKREVTLGNNTRKAVDNAHEIWKNAGFPIEEIGEIITETYFKPSWSKAKETMKFGSPKKDLIENIFPEPQKKITIKEIVK